MKEDKLMQRDALSDVLLEDIRSLLSCHSYFIVPNDTHHFIVIILIESFKKKERLHTTALQKFFRNSLRSMKTKFIVFNCLPNPSDLSLIEHLCKYS